MRFRRLAALVAMSLGLGLTLGGVRAGAAEPLAPLTTTVQGVVDVVGDVLNQVTAALIAPRADITSASLEYAPGWIKMRVQLAAPTDPVRDHNWWTDRGGIVWTLETTGDDKPEFYANYRVSNGAVLSSVYRTDGTFMCSADSATFSPADGYTILFNPACIGRPARLGYAVWVGYATNARDPKSIVVEDDVPDHDGFITVAAPGSVPPAAGPAIAPLAVAPPAPPSPSTVSPSTGAAPVSALAKPAPSAPKPTPAPTRPAAANGPTAAPITAGQPVDRSAPARSGPAPVTSLSRTGAASAQTAALGIGLFLTGAGLLVMTRRDGTAAPLPGS